MKRLLLLILMLVTIVACAKPTDPKLQLKWTGESLEGARFGQREMAGVTVHYAAPTTPENAERIAHAASFLVRNHTSWGRLTATERVDLWVVPAGQKWPQGLPAAPPGRQARAPAPMAVVIEEGAAVDQATDAGLPEAVAVAVTQSAGSPVFVVDWLHEGTGGALSGAPNTHPSAGLLRAQSPAASLLAALAGGDPLAYRSAAISLATLVMDRWGVAWGAQYPRPVGELTPGAALLWATGAPDQAAGLALWQERIDKAASADPKAAFPAMADMSPVRVEPKLNQLPPGPGPNFNYSPHSYDIAARYDLERRQVTGEEMLRWSNGETVPIETLYFNLWPNSEQYAKFGGAIAVQSVTVDGRAAAYTSRGLDLVVPLGRSVAPGAFVDVQIHFTTRMPATITPRVLGQATGPDRFNLAHWYPILAVLDDRGWNLHAFPDFPGEPYSENANFHVKLDVPAGLVVAATGHPVGRSAEGDRWLYEWTAPNVKDWIASGGRGFVEETRKVGDVTIRVLDRDKAVARTILDETERTLQLFEPQFGRYAYPDLVVVPCCAWVEYPGLFYTEPPTTLRGNWWHGVLYHELTHQWFYGMVGNDQYSEAWLDEGFARYGERYGLKAFGYPDQLRDIYARVIPPEVHVNSSTVAFNIYGGYTPAVYDLGAVLLEDLEARLGSARFRQLLNRWTETYRFKTATTADFVRMASQVAGEDLTDFFLSHKIDLGAREPYRPVMPLGRVNPK
ncbi:MAG TPA: M1 family metallopeptidase [Symbiobacteriaceae bacterium]|nr:M1 family metallopeptidase [Symbiobacteriaceae bacterium]